MSTKKQKIVTLLLVKLLLTGFANAKESIQISVSDTIGNAENGANEIKLSAYAPSTGIRGAFLGSLIHPGFKFGVERPYKVIQKDKYLADRVKTIYKERYLSYSLGMYYQSNYHTNFLLQIERVKRRQKSSGFYYETSLGTGVSRTFVDGTTYEVSDDGQINKVSLSGNWFALVSIGGGLGYNFNVRKQSPYTIYIKHHWLLLLPYNSLATPRPTLELGLNYRLPEFLKANPKYIQKTKYSKKFLQSVK